MSQPSHLMALQMFQRDEESPRAADHSTIDKLIVYGHEGVVKNKYRGDIIIIQSNPKYRWHTYNH